MANGLMVFHTVADALRAGFAVYDRYPGGYVVRQRTAAGYATALVILKGAA